MNLKLKISSTFKKNEIKKHSMEDSYWCSSILGNIVTRHGCGWLVAVGLWLCLMEPSAVNHLWQFLQQVILSDARVHVFPLQMVLSEFIDKLLKVIHSRAGGSSAGGGCSYACSPWFGLSGSLQHWAEMYREACYLLKSCIHIIPEKNIRMPSFNCLNLLQTTCLMEKLVWTK